MKTCYYCGPTDRVLRPYGPDGSTVCNPCVKADPERNELARQAFYALFSAAATVNDGIVIIGNVKGPT